MATQPTQAQTLFKQFNTILFGAKPNQTNFYVANIEDGGAIARALLGATVRRDQTEIVSENPADWVLHDEQVQMLGHLFMRQDVLGKRQLTTFANEGMKSTHRRYAGHLFIFLATHHGIRPAFDAALESVQVDELSWPLLQTMKELLMFNWNALSDDDLEHVLEVLRRRWGVLQKPEYESRPRSSGQLREPLPSEVAYGRVKGSMNFLLKQLKHIQYLRLKAVLFTGENLEINQDKRTLTSELSRLGFSNELVESLEHAEVEYRKADSDFDFKTSADHNRSFFDELLWQMANKVAELLKEPFTVVRKNSQGIRAYLKTSGFLSDREHSLCEAFYWFASEQSTHKLSSPREVARIVRNMNIELGLLLMQQMESFRKALP